MSVNTYPMPDSLPETWKPVQGVPSPWFDNPAGVPYGPPDQSGSEAILDYSDVGSEVPDVPPAAKDAIQFEPLEGTISAGGTLTFEASWRPQMWTVYAVTVNNTDIFRVSNGRTANRPSAYLQYRAVLQIPGTDRFLTVFGQAVTTPNTVIVAIASSNCPVVIQQA